MLPLPKEHQPSKPPRVTKHRRHRSSKSHHHKPLKLDTEPIHIIHKKIRLSNKICSLNNAKISSVTTTDHHSYSPKRLSKRPFTTTRSVGVSGIHQQFQISPELNEVSTITFTNRKMNTSESDSNSFDSGSTHTTSACSTQTRSHRSHDQVFNAENERKKRKNFRAYCRFCTPLRTISSALAASLIAIILTTVLITILFKNKSSITASITTKALITVSTSTTTTSISSITTSTSSATTSTSSTTTSTSTTTTSTSSTTTSTSTTTTSTSSTTTSTSSTTTSTSSTTTSTSTTTTSTTTTSTTTTSTSSTTTSTSSTTTSTSTTTTSTSSTITSTSSTTTSTSSTTTSTSTTTTSTSSTTTTTSATTTSTSATSTSTSSTSSTTTSTSSTTTSTSSTTTSTSTTTTSTSKTTTSTSSATTSTSSTTTSTSSTTTSTSTTTTSTSTTTTSTSSATTSTSSTTTSTSTTTMSTSSTTISTSSTTTSISSTTTSTSTTTTSTSSTTTSTSATTTSTSATSTSTSSTTTSTSTTTTSTSSTTTSTSTTTTSTSSTTTSTSSATTSTSSTTTSTSTTTTSTSTTTTSTSSASTSTSATTTSTSSTSTTTAVVCNSCLNQTWISPLGLLAKWQFNGSFIDDMNTYNATAMNSPSFVTNGYVNQALVLNSASNQYLYTPYIPLINANFTIEVWLYPTTFPNPTDLGILGLCTYPANDTCLHLTIRKFGATYSLYMSFFGDSCKGNASVPLNQWTHAAFAFDWDTYTMSIYQNGQLTGSCISALPLQGIANNVTIGYIPGIVATYGSNFFKGYIDQLTIVNRSKVACEILDDATLATYYNFANNSLLSDSGPNSLPCTSQYVFSVSPGHTSNAIAFNGTTAYVQISDVTTLGITSKSFSISLWIQPYSLVGTLVFVSATAVGSSWCIPFIGFATNGALIAQMWNSAPRAVYGPTNLTSSVWHHIVETWSSTNGLQLYVDNALVASNTSVVTYTASSVSDYITLANRPASGCTTGAINSQPSFNGNIDDFRIYSRELTVDDVCALYYYN